MKTDFSKIESKLSVYLKIMNAIQKTNVAMDQDFQRMFNGFYRMQKRSPRFYETFYHFLEEHKHDQNLTYFTILQTLYQVNSTVERSFSSKLLATVCPEYPVWDIHVLNNLGKKAPPYGTKDLNAIVCAYKDICAWYQTDEAKEKVTIFDLHFPNIQITDTKKIDFILWQTR